MGPAPEPRARQRGRLDRPRVLEQDHVTAELGLDRRFGELALVEPGHGGAELGHHSGRIEPSRLAARGLRALVLRSFHRQLGNGARALREPGDDVPGPGFLLHQDVARLISDARHRGLDAVVLGLEHVVGDRIGLHEVLDAGVGQDGLPDRSASCHRRWLARETCSEQSQRLPGRHGNHADVLALAPAIFRKSATYSRSSGAMVARLPRLGKLERVVAGERDLAVVGEARLGLHPLGRDPPGQTRPGAPSPCAADPSSRARPSGRSDSSSARMNSSCSA